MERIYLDYAATTPIDREVERAMRPYFGQHFGNPNSLHYFGQKARKAVDESREKITKSITADFNEVIFTGSATEANNLALRGIIRGIRNKELGIRPRIIVSAIEHESILETAKYLEKEGVEVIYLPVDKNGIVNLKKLKEFLNENTILVSVMYANNEIGAIQPIAEISKIIKNFRSLPHVPFPLLHVDAVQAFQFLNCNVNDLGMDLMTLSAHKIYGPKGIGALYVRSNNELGIKNKEFKKNIIRNSSFIIPLITGGGQEFGLRSGTENVAGIAGFAKAIELADRNKEKEYKRISELKKYFWKNLKKIYPKARINGIQEQGHGIVSYPGIGDYPILPNILNVYFPGQKAEDLLIKLDLNGVAVSSGSACASFSAKPSHVLKALGYSDKRINESLRFSMGKYTNKAELSEALKVLRKILKSST